MNYSCEVTINLPRQRMLELFEDQECMKVWQEGFISMELLEGEYYKTGSKSKLLYDMNGKEVEMIETIVNYGFPDDFEALYEAKNVKNWVVNSFIDQGETTLWRADHIFKCSGFMALVTLFGKKNVC